MRRKKSKARLWAVVSDTGQEGDIRDVAVALIRGTRRDANRYAAALREPFDETCEVLGPLEAWSLKRALRVLAADLKGLEVEDQEMLHECAGGCGLMIGAHVAQCWRCRTRSEPK